MQKNPLKNKKLIKDTRLWSITNFMVHMLCIFFYIGELATTLVKTIFDDDCN